MTDRHNVKDKDDEPEDKPNDKHDDKRGEKVHRPHAKPAIEDAGEPMPVVLLEQPDGTTKSVEVPYPPNTQQINVDGVTYVHVGEEDETWIYRPI
jgi:hypothetical protein